MISDMNLKQDVIDELDFEPSVAAEGVGVTVEDGVVTLAGHVPLFFHRTKAEEAVWRVAGVRGLVQELEVRQSGATRRDDEELARRALERLEDTSTVPRGAVRVKVQKSWLMLSGEVEWDYQRRAAAQALETMPGVHGLVNQIRLVPTDVSVDVKERIERALHRHADVEASRVDVRVEEGRVTLSGRVDSVLERGEIRRAAWSAPGVVEVIDELQP